MLQTENKYPVDLFPITGAAMLKSDVLVYISDPIIFDIVEQFALENIDDMADLPTFLDLDIESEDWQIKRQIINEAIQIALCAWHITVESEFVHIIESYANIRPDDFFLRKLANYTIQRMHDYILACQDNKENREIFRKNMSILNTTVLF